MIVIKGGIVVDESRITPAPFVATAGEGIALALFVLGTVVGSIIVEGNLWLKRWIATLDPDR